MVTFVRLRFDLHLRRSGLPPFHFFSLSTALEKRCAVGNFSTSSMSPSVSDMSSVSVAEQLYGRRLAPDPSAVKRFQKPSPPVILSPPIVVAHSSVDEPLHMHLVVVGNAIPATCAILSLLVAILERDYEVDVERVVSSGVYHEDDIDFRRLMPDTALPLTMFSLDDVSHSLESSGGGMELHVITPLRLFHQGRPVRRFDGPVFLGSLMRRVSSLAYYYCNYEFAVDYAYLAECAKKVSLVITADQWSKRVEKNMGFLGRITLTGDLAPFRQFLAAGTICNMGKGASSGYGNYEVVLK